MMDDPATGRDDLALSLRYLRAVNRRLGGVAALLRHLRRWSRRWPRERPVTLLDVGTGSADLPLAARAHAAARGCDLRVTGIDLRSEVIALARAHVAASPDLADGITLVQADALRLTDLFAPGSFDYVHAGLFLHHLPEIEVLTVLRMMDRVARAGIVWNDLVRSPIALTAITLLTLGRPEIIRHDARASVRAGFTRREAIAFARSLDLDYLRYSWSPLAYRFTLAGERPGAW
jgi:hypothetical protein